LSYVRFSEFINVYIDSVAFPPAQEFDFISGHTIHSCCDSCTFPKRVTREATGGNAGLKEETMNCLNDELSCKWTSVGPGKKGIISGTGE